MIFVDCAWEGCDEMQTIGMPEKSGVFTRVECPKCKRHQWLFCSRVQSWSLTESDFLEQYEVNEETKVIKKRDVSVSKEGDDK